MDINKVVVHSGVEAGVMVCEGVGCEHRVLGEHKAELRRDASIAKQSASRFALGRAMRRVHSASRDSITQDREDQYATTLTRALPLFS